MVGRQFVIWLWDGISESIHVLLGNLSPKLAVCCPFIDYALIDELVVVILIWLTFINCLINSVSSDLIVSQQLIHISCFFASRPTSFIDLFAALLRFIQVIVLEEVDQITLSWLKEHISCKLTDSQLLDYLKNVQLFVELLTAICPKPVLSLLLGPEATAAWAWEILETPQAAVLVGEYTPSFDLSLQFVFLIVLIRVFRLFIILANELLLLIILFVEGASSLFVFLLFAILGQLILCIELLYDWIVLAEGLEVLDSIPTKS